MTIISLELGLAPVCHTETQNESFQDIEESKHRQFSVVMMNQGYYALYCF